MNTQKDNHTKWWFNISAIEKFTFLTFLCGILIYGITFAWYMLTSFDIINLIRDVNLDDAFYYFQIARNFADGKFSTFDDGITRTNGYHPVWMLFRATAYKITVPSVRYLGSHHSMPPGYASSSR